MNCRPRQEFRVEISASSVKELREKTGAGMMDCKKALGECGGDVQKAIDYLRQKGLAAAAKKADRVAADGAVGAYVHPGGKIGVLVEINCQTDFVARTTEFQTLLKDMAMQILSLIHISEPTRLLSISYAVFCLKK